MASRRSRVNVFMAARVCHRSTSSVLAAAFETAREQGSVSGKTLRRLNKMLYTSERLLTREQGLPGRPWYKHFIFAPGFYTGYGAKTFPGVREPIEQRRFEQVDEQIVIVSGILDDFSARLDEAAELLEQ